MAEPGDHDVPDHAPATGPTTQPDPHDHDDLIGFCSPASLQGRRREPVPVPVEAAPEPEAQPVVATQTPDRLVQPAPLAVEEPAMTMNAPPSPTPSRALSPDETFGRREDREAQPEKAMSLYAVYSLILFAVPTLGVSALIGLLAVTGRAPPASGIGRTHYIFQQRTLWSAAVIALLGLILIVVNIGVFVLFVLALWILVRGAVGVWRLKAGQPISNPLTWLI